MNPRSSLRFFIVLAAVVAALGIGFASQWRQSALLRIELERATHSARELRQLQDENRRLREEQISSAELERLRADHAALPRLRAELDTLARQVAPATNK